MKRILPFLLLLFPIFANAAIELCQSRAVVVPVGELYYDPGNAGMLQSALIADTTSTVASWTCTLYKGIGAAGTAVTAATTAVTLAASGSSNDCWRPGPAASPGWAMELTTGNTDTVGGLRIEITYAGRLPMVTYYEVLPALEYILKYEGTDSVSARIASATALQSTIRDQVGVWAKNATDTIVVARDQVGVWAKNATDTITSVSQMVVAGGSIISASGMTRPSVYVSRTGDTARTMWFEGLSTGSATPTVAFELTDAVSGMTLWATEAALTYSSFTSHDGFYHHRFRYPISDSMPDGWYPGLFRNQTAGQWTVTPFLLVLDPTPSIDESNLATQTWMTSNLIHPASQTAEKSLSGFPQNYQIFTTNVAIPRTVAGVSSASNLHATAGVVVGASVTFSDFFSGVTTQKNFVFDYDEITEQRSAVFDIGSVTVYQHCKDVLSVTDITTAGGIN